MEAGSLSNLKEAFVLMLRFAKFYDLAKKQAPSSLAPGIETIESSIVSYGTPIVGKAKEVAPKILTAGKPPLLSASPLAFSFSLLLSF